MLEPSLPKADEYGRLTTASPLQPRLAVPLVQASARLHPQPPDLHRHWGARLLPLRQPRKDPMSDKPAVAEKRRLSYLTVAQTYRLDMACQQIKVAFGCYPYLVGSVLHRPDFRDVDLRLPMCEARGGTDLTAEGPRLRFLNAAISDWLSAATQLPIDFQFQDETEWASYDDKPRHPRGLRSSS